jgi:hypothetical protein
VDLAKDTTLDVSIDVVSDYAALRVFVDNAPKADWFFSALPGMPDQEEWQLRGQDVKTYYARFNKTRSIDIPAGKHIIELRVIGGDWISMNNLTLRNARPSHFATVETLAMQDASSGETILWCHDQNSNWKRDYAKEGPGLRTGLSISVPIKHTQPCKVDWWDTRAGKIVKTDRAQAQDGELKLQVPEFRRDIAARIVTMG